MSARFRGVASTALVGQAGLSFEEDAGVDVGVQVEAFFVEGQGLRFVVQAHCRGEGRIRMGADSLVFAPVLASSRLRRLSSFGSTIYGNFRGFGVFLQFRTPSMSKNMTFMRW